MKTNFHRNNKRHLEAPVWQEDFNMALNDLSDGKPDGLAYFLFNKADQLNVRQLIDVRNKLLTKVRHKTHRVLGGAALKSHARRFQGLFGRLQNIIDEKQSAKKNDYKKTPAQRIGHSIESTSENFTPDEFLAGIQSATSYEALEKIFQALLLSGRIHDVGRGHFRVTDVGSSHALKEINYPVNRLLCDAYKKKLNELRDRKSSEVNPEKRVVRKLRSVSKPKELQQISGVHNIYSDSKIEIEVIEGESKKGEKLIQVIQVKGGKVSKVKEGNIYKFDALPLELRYLLFPEEKAKDLLRKRQAEEARSALKKAIKNQPADKEKKGKGQKKFKKAA